MTRAASSTAAELPTPTPALAVEARQLGVGMAVIRILLGLTFLLNGLAKLFEFHRVRLGWYVANLIDKADAKFILNAEVNHNAQHRLPLIGRIANHLVLPHWTAFAWLLTAVELTAGLLLTLGLRPRLGALVALVPTAFLFFVYFANDRWVPEQPLEIVPLAVLAMIPSGGVWGLDRHVRRLRRSSDQRS